jgi:hypothetical protein
MLGGIFIETLPEMNKISSSDFWHCELYMIQDIIEIHLRRIKTCSCEFWNCELYIIQGIIADTSRNEQNLQQILCRLAT